MRTIDADGHVIERDAEIVEYFHESMYKKNESLLAFPLFPTLDGFHRGSLLVRNGLQSGGHWTSGDGWVAMLDQLHIESTVLYPTAGLAFHQISDPDWAVSLARAYNDWLHDRYLRVSQRLNGVALLPLHDVPAAVKELRRAVLELGMVGVCLNSNGGEMGIRAGLGDRQFWPIYDEVQKLDVPIGVHGAPCGHIGMNFARNFAIPGTLEHVIPQMIQLTSMVVEGVFETFPRLRVAFLEANAGWVPFMMDRLDRTAGLQNAKRKLSDYIPSGQIYFSIEGDESSLMHVINMIGYETLLFASDIPHENNVARCRHEIDDIVHHEKLTGPMKAAICASNAERFYGERFTRRTQQRRT